MSEPIRKLVAGAVRQRGVPVPADQVAQAEALLEDLLAAASRHPCAQTDSARDFYLPRAALDIVTGSAKREAKEAKRASNREAHRLRVVAPGNKREVKGR
jgi:hypothetical protein